MRRFSHIWQRRPRNVNDYKASSLTHRVSLSTPLDTLYLTFNSLPMLFDGSNGSASSSARIRSVKPTSLTRFTLRTPCGKRHTYCCKSAADELLVITTYIAMGFNATVALPSA